MIKGRATAEVGGFTFRFVELAQEINAQMPSYIMTRLGDLLNDPHRSVTGRAS